MKRPVLRAILISILLFVFSIGKMNTVSAQQATPTPILATEISQSSTDLEQRIERMEIVQEQTITTFVEINEYNKFLLQVTGLVITVMLGVQGLVQGFITYFQFRREREREERQSQREAKFDEAQLTGAKQVSEIMTVVQQTLESRRMAEEEARRDARNAQRQLAEVSKKFERLDIFYESFQSNIRKLRSEIEQNALDLSINNSRHDFKIASISESLNDFAHRFDNFITDYQGVEQGKYTFTAYVPYIRGIAAHYANQPGVAEEYLKQVINRQSPEPGEAIYAYNRRKANSFYYLGLNESNFGRYEDAIKYFEEGDNLDSQKRDFLTKVVIAEAYILSGEFTKAETILNELESRMEEIRQSQGELKSSEERLKSRVALMRANMLFLTRQDSWIVMAQTLLKPVQEQDPSYYYVTATLGQLAHLQKNYELAKSLFKDVSEIILNTDIRAIREARSKVLVLMIAGMATKYAENERLSKDYLIQADEICNNLPKIGLQFCTVFSTLSKRNESSDMVKQHINLIRTGTILL